MRVGIYTPNYPGLTSEGGIGTYTRFLGHGLSDLGHEVHVLTPGDRAPADDGPVRVHFTRMTHLPIVDRLLPGAGACLRTARALRRLMREDRLDLVELANWEGYGLLYMHLPRIPTVVRLSTSSQEAQEIDGLAASRRLRWDGKRERWQARAADALATHSAAHARLMADEIGVPAEAVRVIPLAVPVFPDFVRPPRPPGPPTVVYLGRLEHRKGTVELLQAIPQVLAAVPDARFVLIGADRPHCPGGRTHAQYLEEDFAPEVRRQVTLAGRLPQADVDRWLQTADVFVAPSRYESFGLIFLEAMRWGTPVIGTMAGGIPEIVEHGRSGLLVRPEAPADLAAALIRLLRDPGLRAGLGAAGRQRAEQEFSIEQMARRTAALYDEVLATDARRSPPRRIRPVAHAT
ncbi:MAG: glycosyltransferase family 4 protein [Zavarzinella sp.]|nr:glycosyltransferase family 4 protein [Zavarzinella sp.]